MSWYVALSGVKLKTPFTVGLKVHSDSQLVIAAPFIFEQSSSIKMM